MSQLAADEGLINEEGDQPAVMATAKWNRGVRSRTKHGDFGADDPTILREASNLSSVCNDARGLGFAYFAVHSCSSIAHPFYTGSTQIGCEN